jgi:DNA polymerase-4
LDRAIIHLNVADFAVAVERSLDARLRTRPLIIAPEGSPRATVFDMSEETFGAGVRKGMGLRRAQRLCREALVRPLRTACYEQAMRALVRQALPFTPLVEPGEADGHLFLDVTGSGRLFGPPMDVAWRLRRQARADLGLDPIWAVAPNKLVAKVATRLVKPDGEYIVGAGEEEAFLAPLPLHLVPGIEGEDLVRLGEFNFTCVGQVTALGLEALRVPFGRRAGFLYGALRGEDASPVRAVGQRPPRAVFDHTFAEDTQCGAVLEGALYALVEQAGTFLRRGGQAARRLAVSLDFSDGVRRIRQRRAQAATANDATLFALARAALHLAGDRRVRVRHLRLACDGLTFPPAQMALFPGDPEDDRQQHLVAALDRIRQRFGDAAIRVGRTLAA